MRRADPLLIATVCVQWLVTAGVALTAHRTGSIYGTEASARAVADAANRLADGTLPHTGGPAYPVLLAPLAAVTDSANTFAAVVTALGILVLAPAASYCLLDLAQSLAGRPYAVLAAAVWLLAPVAAVPLFVTKYHDTYVDNVLPALYGLTLHPAYLAMVLSLAAAALAMRAVAGAPRAALFAGLLAALATAVLPVAAAIAVGAGLALAAARRWRGLLETAIGLAAGLAPTLLWRERALGSRDAHARSPLVGRVRRGDGERAGVLLVEPPAAVVAGRRNGGDAASRTPCGRVARGLARGPGARGRRRAVGLHERKGLHRPGSIVARIRAARRSGAGARTQAHAPAARTARARAAGRRRPGSRRRR